MAVEYASNAKGNTGVALGATGLGLAVANILGNGCGNGLLGNLLSGNCGCNEARMGAGLTYMSQLQAENAMLKSENYADKIGKEVYAQTLIDNKSVRTELQAGLNALIDETHTKAVADAEKIARLEEQLKCCCEKQALQAQITAGKINEATLALNGKIDTMQANYNGAFNSLNQTIACVQGSVAGITNRLNALTEEIVPICKVCPQPMQRFNTWATPTAQAPDCTGVCAN